MVLAGISTERIRVEALLSHLYTSASSGTPDIHTLREPATLNIPSHEVRLLSSRTDAKEALAYWGFGIALSEPRDEQSSTGMEMQDMDDANGDAAQNEQMILSVTHVPTVVHERLIGDRILLTDVVRSLFAWLESMPHWTPPRELPDPPKGVGLEGEGSEEGDEEGGSETRGFAWLSVLRHCPPRLLDLINSKACRGAYSPRNGTEPAGQC